MVAEKTKKIIFTIPEQDKAKFKIQLQHDNLTQAQFLRGMIAGYLRKDIDFMNFVSKMKGELGAQSKVNIKKALKNVSDAKGTSNQFALGDEEVDNIFDMLEKEHPEL
jgi:hypothetical protein|tara:strand:+ start:88 stop:411 length:324 start_codon:yes stop_codon:yes gene_type:complete